jgi:hypothetical protein
MTIWVYDLWFSKAIFSLLKRYISLCEKLSLMKRVLEKWKIDYKNWFHGINDCQSRLLLSCCTFILIDSNVFDHYLVHYHYLASPQTLFFTFSPRRRQRRRQQYEIFQKTFYETSLNNTKMILSIASVRNNRMFQFIDTRHSTFTFCFVFISFWSQWRYFSHIWDQNLLKTWKVVDKWRFWSMISSNEFLLMKLIDWWSIDDRLMIKKLIDKELEKRLMKDYKKT